MDPALLVLILVSYLAGGIPTGYLVARRLKGIDIREHGSGNPGTANVYRVVGPAAGAVTLAVDALKGYAPVLAAQRLLPDQPWAMILCGAAAIIGHDWTVFLGMRGGKGVATSAGVFAAMMPRPVAWSALVFAAGYAVTGHISVGSMGAAVSLPLFAWMLGAERAFTAMAAGAAVLILYKHLPNIRRLLAGRELTLDGRR